MPLSPTYPIKQEFSTPSQTWQLVHNLKRPVSCVCALYIEGTLTQVVPKNITFPDDNTVVIEWTKAYAGILTVR